MIQYFETSIILSLILEDEFHAKASKIWNQKNDVFCSILTAVEARIVLRRFYKSNKSKLTSNWLSKNEKKLNEILSECSLVKIDESILSIVEIKKEISDCRSLDAIHIATAIFLKDKFNDSSFQFYSFDNRVKEVAKKLGLKPHSV
jgi:predicted nucleic acid-binding protein